MIAFIQRLLAKRHLNRAEDTGCELPNWVQQLLESDQELAEYQTGLQTLRQKLVQDRAEWSEKNFPASAEISADESAETEERFVELLNQGSTDTKHAANSRFMNTAACLAAAASIAILIVALQNMPGSGGAAITNPSGQDGVAEVDEIDMKPLLATANASSQVAMSISDGTNRWFDKLASRVAPASQETVDAPEALMSRTRENLRDSEGRMRTAIRSFATTLTTSVTGLNISSN